MTQIYKIRSEIWVAPCPEISRPKNINNLARFRTTLQLDREYLRNATRRRQSENGVANCGHSRIGKLNLVYFCPQTAKNRTGVLTHPTGGCQAGDCHASSIVWHQYGGKMTDDNITEKCLRTTCTLMQVVRKHMIQDSELPIYWVKLFWCKAVVTHKIKMLQKCCKKIYHIQHTLKIDRAPWLHVE